MNTHLSDLNCRRGYSKRFWRCVYGWNIVSDAPHSELEMKSPLECQKFG